MAAGKKRDEMELTYEEGTSCGEKLPEFIPLWMRYESIFGRLSDESLGELVRGMLTYAQNSQEPDLQGEGYFLWPMVKQDIDYSRKSYEEKVAAGRKSGEARRAKKKQTEEQTAPQQEEAEVNSPEQKEAETNTPEQRAVNHNHNHNQKQNQNHPHPQKENHASLEEVEEVGEKENAPDAFSLGKKVLSLFYKIRDDLEKPEFIPKQTLQKAEELGRNYPPSAIRTVFRKSRSGFLNGAGEKGWTASLSWLLEEEHFRDVLEGKYDWVQKEKPASEAPPKAKNSAEAMTRRVEQGSAGLGEYERQAIRRMLTQGG